MLENGSKEFPPEYIVVKEEPNMGREVITCCFHSEDAREMIITIPSDEAAGSAYGSE
jgi:hypothetical protein